MTTVPLLSHRTSLQNLVGIPQPEHDFAFGMKHPLDIKSDVDSREDKIS
jgi:hypothetical protein